MTSEYREWEIGRHQFRFEPPDIIWNHFRGPISLDEVKRMVAMTDEVSSAQPYFIIGDMEESGMLEPEAGRYLSEHLRFEHILGMVYVRARLIHRGAAQGILLAAYLTEHTTDVDVVKKVHFVSTLAEAHALIARLRAEGERLLEREPPTPSPRSKSADLSCLADCTAAGG